MKGLATIYKLMLFIISVDYVHSHGCIPIICEGNIDNSLRRCPDYDNTCGSYGGKRFDERYIKGVDILCQPSSAVYAPFDGVITYQRPFRDNSCIDHGLRITGEGQWIGYIAVISYIEPIRYGGRVHRGDIIGHSLTLSCLPRPDSHFEPHILFQLYLQGQPVNPTYHLKECMCTGQVCESNVGNKLASVPYQNTRGFGKGWTLKCHAVQELTNSGEMASRLPDIYAPIDGHFLGRFRPMPLADGVEDYQCTNNGIFILDFTAHIYNAKFSIEPGKQTIRQGQKIGQRLDCPSESFSNNIFIELRYKGRFANFTNLILGEDCKLPPLH
ncbi:Leukocyte cell-derived chemotaxin-2 [Trichinella pseudospiralis]|uniref:Leukocyte cell-derived chemotaxin-2 n=1 Tax=Trichinella pseudospiralis TaxID=6337 RepID=A0A0V1FJD3_TRIPS|nr:Leukocyte cell-derived chemotaxin-2 [Trichinella pseudospiralis]